MIKKKDNGLGVVRSGPMLKVKKNKEKKGLFELILVSQGEPLERKS